MKNESVMVAHLSGAVNAEIAVVKHGGSFFVKAPKELGGLEKVKAESLTDCINFKAWEWNEELKKKARKNGPKGTK